MSCWAAAVKDYRNLILFRCPAITPATAPIITPKSSWNGDAITHEEALSIGSF
jgi:hypothetical protein